MEWSILVLGEGEQGSSYKSSMPTWIQDCKVSNFEIKSFDGCANPYLGLASMIAAGIDGLRRHLTLPKPVGANPSELDGKLQRIPVSLSESSESLIGDSIFKDFIGENLLVAVKGV